MRELAETVSRHLSMWEQEFERRLWTGEDTIVVGVSGGPDSLALLHLLARDGLHDPQGLVVGHLDHGLRENSAAEAHLLSRICEEWGVRVVIAAADVGALAAENKWTVEEAARRARYKFLGELASQVTSNHVLVGHNADDQAETILMHLLRGAGLRGLRGMLPVRAVPGFPRLTLVRPLLQVSRPQVEDYCARHNLRPIRDPSNESPIYFRNQIRHDLLPTLEQYSPQIRYRLQAMSQILRADADYLERQASAALRAIVRHADAGAVRLDLTLWRQLPLSLRRRTLRQLVSRLNKKISEVGYASIEQARRLAEEGEVGAQSSLPDGFVLEVEYRTLLIHTGKALSRQSMPQLVDDAELPLPIPGSVQLAAGWTLQANLVELAGGVHLGDDAWSEYIDADSVGNLFVRARQPGDRLQPLGLHGKSSKIADIMIDERIPEKLRARWPIVVNQNHVVWLVGIRLDERVRINENTQRVIQLRCQRNALGRT